MCFTYLNNIYKHLKNSGTCIYESHYFVYGQNLKCFTGLKNDHKYGSDIQITVSKNRDEKEFHVDLHKSLK